MGRIDILRTRIMRLPSAEEPRFSSRKTNGKIWGCDWEDRIDL
jgi:hypothetical protein